MPLGDHGGAVGARKTDAGASRRFRLKAATQEAHDCVEGVVRDAGMVDTPAGWLAYCEATYTARAEVERALTTAGAEAMLPGWGRRCIADLLATDIIDLGGRLHRGEPVVLTGPGELLGAMYVLEGSSLGARIIMGLAGGMGFTQDFGARHIHAQAGEGWRAFVAVLEAADLDPEEEARMTRTANAMFARFAAAYARGGPAA